MIKHTQVIKHWLNYLPVVSTVSTITTTEPSSKKAANDSRFLVTKRRQSRCYLTLSLGNQVCQITRRQADVILQLPGRRIKTIAVNLGISPTTVKSHIDALAIRLNCVNRVDLVRCIHRHHLIQQCQHAIR